MSEVPVSGLPLGVKAPAGWVPVWATAVARFARHKPLGALGGIVIAMMVVLAALSYVGLADHVTRYGYDEQVLEDRLQGPSRSHLLGTDHLGRDLLSRVVHGARVSITIGFLAVLLSETLAVLVGVSSGFVRGRFDTVAQRLVDIWQAMPGLLMLIFLIAIFGQSPVVMIVAIGTLRAASGSRLIRGATLGVVNEQYIEAARAMGAGHLRIMARHVVPNIFHIVLIAISISIGGAILVESTLAFLGFGLPPPFPTWGRMLNDSRSHLAYPWPAIVPGMAITLTVFAFNILGDALRDVLDPRLRGSR
ncbi:MAG: ABC transporter permease subunit [Gemmatimonas sp.]|nr:ABC transporter permease subunit [Gemmatimonas sp.]